MPSYRGHLAGGAAAYVIVLQCIKSMHPGIHMVIQGLFFCLLGSLFPDVDTKSKGQKIFYTILLIFLLYCVFMAKLYLCIAVALLGVIPMLVRHRGLFHQAWFLLLITLAAIVILTYVFPKHEKLLISNSWFFFAGTLSHIVLDRVLTKTKRYFRKG